MKYYIKTNYFDMYIGKNFKIYGEKRAINNHFTSDITEAKEYNDKQEIEQELEKIKKFCEENNDRILQNKIIGCKIIESEE